jgi:hypothetical protein
MALFVDTADHGLRIRPFAVYWPTVNEDQLLADIVAPLCTAYVNSCTT